MKCVSIVNHFAPSVESVPSVVETLPVGGRLQLFGGFLPAGGFAFPPAKTSGSSGSKFPSFLQPPLSGSQTKQKVASHTGSKHLKPILEGKVIQDGDPRVHTAVPPTRRVGNAAGLQRRVLPHSRSPSIKKIPQVPLPRSNLPVQGPPLWPFDGSYGVHSRGQGGQVDGPKPRYKDPPIPRRLVDKRPNQGFLSPGYPNSAGLMSGAGLVGEPPKIGTGTEANLQFCRLPVQPSSRSGLTHTGQVAVSTGQDPRVVFI